ncbi:MAG: immune inhibitor A [Spongiibacteraceae bacterium]|nr:immune inhibitor A [Spongiibacteraceae bacterium]
MIKILPALVLCATVLSPELMAAKSSHHSSGDFDAAIANEAKLIEMLKRSGKISAQASISEAETALKNYLTKRMQANPQITQDLPESTVEMLNSAGRLHTHQTLKHKKKKYRHNRFRPDPISLETYDGEKRTAKILSILMEFPDFPHNSIEPGESDMYYEDYNREHYQDLLFSSSGVTGPNGENFMSMVSYYEAQSGNSYSVEGSVAGWYMASQPAAFYGNNNDGDARSLIREALLAAAADPSVDLSEFDIEDRYDLDGDGDYWEPDGLIDHVQIFHSSVGEEAGGGQLGEDAVWSHRSNLFNVFTIEGTSTDIPTWGGQLAAFDYTIQPADAAAGVVSHEYGHDLGLPDEYDTQYSGEGEPVSSWSIMSSGSWAGLVPGSEPTGFSAWAKEFLQQAHSGNWLHGETFSIDDLSSTGEIVLLDRAVSKGTNNDAVRIDLPDKEILVTTPVSGLLAYHSGKGDNLYNSMSITADLRHTTQASLQFKTWYDIESDWDYAYILVDDGSGPITIPSRITTNENPNGQNLGNGITGTSTGWIDAEFDLSNFSGQMVSISFVYRTDVAVTGAGLYVDDIVISADGVTLLSDNADSEPLFILDGFSADPGFFNAQHYYLLEWRIHHGIDIGLSHVRAAGALLPFNQGLIIWYVDASFDENWTGIHPGEGFLGVVDADQKVNKWSDGEVASTRYQMHDAAFDFQASKRLFIDQTESSGVTLTDYHIRAHKYFRDTKDYSSPLIPDAGRIIPEHGLKIQLLSQSHDKSVVKLLIKKQVNEKMDK